MSVGLCPITDLGLMALDQVSDEEKVMSNNQVGPPALDRLSTDYLVHNNPYQAAYVIHLEIILNSTQNWISWTCVTECERVPENSEGKMPSSTQ